ncbi:MAG TPA: flagellar filament capping protein FliD [Terracidiphilus sp.]|nr:flagellar filament capping protein FliD [Terracidiphilus sp.]
MGTVGLSFGSATSGTGFDVSTTVASIVSNLQNVETPWKNQLSSLQSQDTALSNLGSLLSTLSTDLSQLTDLQGTLAQKTGSSSDTNVLELTSASASAVAGTHTVVVNSLAKTSSGYLTVMSDSSDTLSGSITIQVGSGTAQTISVGSSSDTLSTLASAINSAGIGVTASVLTDSSGSRLSIVSGTSGSSGNLTITSALTDSTTSTSLNYTSTVTGVDASLTIDGIDLTSSSNTVSNLIPGVSFQLLSASSSGSEVQVVIGNYNTGVESAVSSLVSDYNALVSAINVQEGTDSSGNAEPLFGSPTLSLLQQQLLGSINTQNPSGYFDTITNSSDLLTGSISIQVGSGTAQTISLDSSGETLSQIASQINNAGLGVTANLVSSTTGTQLTLVSNTAGSTGNLTVTSSITDSTTSKSVAYNDNSSDLSSLSQLGISVNSDGTLTLNTSSLDSVLTSDFSGVVGFFQDANSWGSHLSTVLTSAGTSSSTGILKLAINSNSSIESNLNVNISREESLISVQQKSLTAELNSANEILQSIPSQIKEISEIYAAITGYNSSNG